MVSHSISHSLGLCEGFCFNFDANITTLLVAVILFALGTGPVKGLLSPCLLESSRPCLAVLVSGLL